MDQNHFGRAPRIGFDVTQKNIEIGLARNSSHCPIAEALRAAHPEFVCISVDLQTIRATDKKKGERYVWLTPRVGQLHIVNTDQGHKSKLKPFRIECRDGQVTAAGGKNGKKKGKAKLRMSRGGNKTTVPERDGGKTPPISFGRRRAFGLRGLVL